MRRAYLLTPRGPTGLRVPPRGDAVARQGVVHLPGLERRHGRQLARGKSVIKRPSPLNVLKDTYGHSCYLARSVADEYQHFMTDSSGSLWDSPLKVPPGQPSAFLNYAPEDIEPLIYTLRHTFSNLC
jgi:hypothetical protein